MNSQEDQRREKGLGKDNFNKPNGSNKMTELAELHHQGEGFATQNDVTVCTGELTVRMDAYQCPPQLRWFSRALINFSTILHSPVMGQCHNDLYFIAL